MKTALLLPGHMRRFREALANQHACVVEPLNCDIFISTSTADTSVNGNNIYVENHLLGDLQRLVRGAYGSRLKGLVVEEGESEKEAKLGAKQWMRLKQCNQARKEYEKENGFKYDFVVWRELIYYFLENYPLMMLLRGLSLCCPTLTLRLKYMINSLLDSRI